MEKKEIDNKTMEKKEKDKISEAAEKPKRNLPDWLQRIKNIKHIEIIAVLIVIAIIVVAYTYTVKGKNVTDTVGTSETETLTAELTNILKKIDGVGDVEILILYNGGKQLEIASKTEKHTDVEVNGDRTTTTTNESSVPVIVDGDKPLIIGEKRAVIDGVIVVADGGGDNAIKVQIMQALSKLLKIDFDKVQVFKAKK